MTQPTRVHHSAGLTAGATSILLAVAGCAPAGSGAGDGERIEGGTITYAHYQEPPCLWGGWVQQAYTSRQVFDSLVSYGDDGVECPRC
ncbi:hypothetical protein [Sediminivirga luteola]|uniref:hypothetical protein n=1 Tax=Sediminivirga luteola TaxID=1774748 RepID=UPI001F33887A|nr:hypothetical protein [Sediminivirga luteola]